MYDFAHILESLETQASFGLQLLSLHKASKETVLVSLHVVLRQREQEVAEIVHVAYQQSTNVLVEMCLPQTLRVLCLHQELTSLVTLAALALALHLKVASVKNPVLHLIIQLRIL